MNKVKICDQNDRQLGFVKIGGFVPAFLLLDGKLYQRYGQVSNYRYVNEPEVFIPNAGEMTIEAEGNK